MFAARAALGKQAQRPCLVELEPELRNMITKRSARERGHAHHGWLEAFHTFSFADYFDPRFLGYGPLRVINQDRVEPGQGFPTHAHRDMEIVTYVLDGALEHKDSLGNGSRIVPGEVQFMSAGSGVTHSEFNPSPTQVLHLLQMWVVPARRGGVPRYEQRTLAAQARQSRLATLLSPDGRDQSIVIGQDAVLYASLLDGSDRVSWQPTRGRRAWLHLAKGSLELNGQRLEAGDGAAIENEDKLEFARAQRAEFVLWDLPQA